MPIRWNWNRWPLALLAVLLAGGRALAHEKWYAEETTRHFAVPEYFLRPTAFGALVVLGAAAALIFFWLIGRTRGGTALSKWWDGKLQQLHLKPRAVLGAMIGVSLMGAGLQGTLFSPNLALPDSAWGQALRIAEIVLGTLFLFLEPLYAELGVLLAALYLAGFSVLPPWNLLEELLLLGAAIFFVTHESARRPWWRWKSSDRSRQGYQMFRVLTAMNFLVLASVKWLRPDLAMRVVEEYGINFLSRFGLGTAEFVFCAAVVETGIALALLFRVAFRPAVLAAFLFFTLSIYFLGFRELLGHLPIKAALFLFFIYGHWRAGDKKAAE